MEKDGDRRKSIHPSTATTGAQQQQQQQQQQEELVATSASQKNWRGIGIALLVILVVCSLIVTAVVLLTPSNEGPRVKGERITLDDILGENFAYQRFNGTWVSDYEFAYRNEDGVLLQYDARSGNTTTLVTNSTFRIANALEWSLSPDRQFLLLTHDIQKLFRYSYLAKYKIYSIKTGDLYPLTPIPGKQPLLQYAAWGPKESALVMVLDNDIYYKPNATGDVTRRLTKTGVQGVVWNGVPDWIYEEEILSTNKALWFSPDGLLLCYASFNDTNVETMNIPIYGDISQAYPKMESIKYPKPGLNNPVMDLHILHLTEPDHNPSLKPPPFIEQQDHYFTAVRWINNTQVSVIWMNRAQNVSIITICNAPLWYCNKSHPVESGGHGWVDLYQPPLFSADGSRYYIVLPAQDGAYGLYNQVAVKHILDDRLEFLTHGKWEVTEIKKYDEIERTLYYIVAPEGKPGERHLYKIRDNDTNSSDKRGECMTCNLSPDCLYVDAIFSRNASYFILSCEGPGVPTSTLYDTRKNVAIVEWISNSKLKDFIAKKAMPQVRTFRVPLEKNFEAQVRLHLPPGLRDDEITRYPLVLEVYAGPGSQIVNERFRAGIGAYFPSKHNFIYAYADGRGSGFQGSRLLHEIYRQLGSVEVQDQIAVTEYLRDNLHFVEGNKIALWGASYGGYVTAMVMGMEKQVFNCGISLAPVTDWHYYDTVYTERYMGMPTTSDNEDGYKRSSVLMRAANFKTKKFFLMHGTRDDNVHFQQSMMLTKALVRDNVIFRMQVYPDENHSLYGVKRHQIESMEDFLDECFRVEKKEQIGLQDGGKK